MRKVLDYVRFNLLLLIIVAAIALIGSMSSTIAEAEAGHWNAIDETAWPRSLAACAAGRSQSADVTHIPLTPAETARDARCAP